MNFDYSRAGSPKPDFLLIGVPNPSGGVILIASRSVYAAEVEHTREYEDLMSGYHGLIARVPGFEEISITALLRDYVLITANTYGEAFSNLFNTWKPDDLRRPHAQIEGQEAIDGSAEHRSLEP